MAFGEIPGYPPGSLFDSKHELAACGLHWNVRGGIAGRQAEGAESVVLNGGYLDDEDRGDEIVYTGAGGQDETGRHVQHQELVRGTRALLTSLERGLPVRVIRRPKAGYDPPREGYRYDGLYSVVACWPEIGLEDFRVWRFRMKKLPADGLIAGAPERLTREPEMAYEAAPRADVVVRRIVRDTAVTRWVKARYDHACQVCGERLVTPAGLYAEAAHVRPLGRPHDGPDTRENVLCLCPNHHVLFDRWKFAVADDHTLVGLPGALTVRHRLDTDSLRYHRDLFEAAAA